MKAYILRIDTELSHAYAKTAADSCERINLEYEFVDGFTDMSGEEAWYRTGLNIKKNARGLPLHCGPDFSRFRINRAECASAGHALIWKKIAEGSDDVAIILEHDAIMLHPIDINIPDNMLVVLGYKIRNPEKYQYLKAGPPRDLIAIDGHEGAHAYMLTKLTAQTLVTELTQKGLLGCVDNAYFLKMRKTQVPLVIMSPTPAVGWLRESTIWATSSDRNYTFIPSFQNFYSV
jgi:hypothetical protein